MKTLTYRGPVGVREIGTADGLDVDRTFPRGEPTEISDADAALILAGPHAAEFTTDEEA